MDANDHDLLIEIRTDIKQIQKDMSECDQRYNQLRREVNAHDRLLNRMKGATAATIIFVSAFGMGLIYLFVK